MNGVALKLQQVDGFSPVQILNMHIARAKEMSQVLYSTDLPFGAQKANLDSVIFYFKNSTGITTFVQADLLSLSRRKDGEPFIPDDSKFSPPEFASDDRRTWMLLRNFRVVDSDYLSTLYTLPDGSKEQSPIIQAIHSSYRINRIYWTDQLGPVEDTLII